MSIGKGLMTVDNYKILKAKEYGFLQIGLHLSPYNLSGYNTCKNATKYCKLSCLNMSGLGSMSKIQESRIRKTKYFFEHTETFMRQVDAEIYYYKQVAKNAGKELCVRMNLTSDIDFQQIFIDGKTLFEIHKSVQFLDYTKEYQRISLHPNYDLTYSYDQVNHKKCMEVLKRGDRLAVVFEKEFPKTFENYDIENGDIHDLRFINSKNCVVALRYKNIIKKGLKNSEFIKDNTLVVKKDNNLNKVKLNIEW